MKTDWKAILCAVFILAGIGISDLRAQGSTLNPVLHIQQSRTTAQGSQNGFPTYLAMYQVLNGGESPAELLSLNGTLSLKNYG